MTDRVSDFFAACEHGDVERARQLITADPSLVGVADPDQPNGRWTALHTAAQHGQVDIVRLLLEHGADPNAREVGDNTYPLHWAAAAGHTEIVRALLDAGGDVHGFGDLHELDAIGWATYFHPDDTNTSSVVPLLLERGARHHIFSALSLGDAELVRELVEAQPESLKRRMSRFEHRLTPLHFAMSRKRYDLLELLIQLGADLEAEDDSGQSALAVAMLRGDQEAMRRLYAAGAKPPTAPTPAPTLDISTLAGSVKKLVPMITVPDVAAALDWYASIGFTEVARYGDNGVVNFGMVAFGDAQLMLNINGKPGKHDADLWFYTDRVDELYQLLKSRQLRAARASLEGDAPAERGIEFVEDLYDPFYGGRQFSIRDLNGYGLLFYQE